MSKNDTTPIPDWLPGKQPERYGQDNKNFIARSTLINCSTLSAEQVTALVKDGRLTAYRTLADKRLQMFDLDQVNALFTPVPEIDGQA